MATYTSHQRAYYLKNKERLLAERKNPRVTLDCICPTCEQHHKHEFKYGWSGSVVPIKRCEPCKGIVAHLDEVGGNRVHARYA